MNQYLPNPRTGWGTFTGIPDPNIEQSAFDSIPLRDMPIQRDIPIDLGMLKPPGKPMGDRFKQASKKFLGGLDFEQQPIYGGTYMPSMLTDPADVGAGPFTQSMLMQWLQGGGNMGGGGY